jgi:hypothetical protein
MVNLDEEMHAVSPELRFTFGRVIVGQAKANDVWCVKVFDYSHDCYSSRGVGFFEES